MNWSPDALPDDDRRRVKFEAMPKRVSPMLATLTHEPFSSDDWIYERKLDGVRCIVHRDRHGAHLFSRNDRRLDRTFPELLPMIEQAIDGDVVADGEIVAFDGRLTSFAKLQGRLGITEPGAALLREVEVELYLFDVLHLDGYDLTGITLRQRKRVLRQVFAWQPRLHFTAHRNGGGRDWLATACRKGWEGLIAKRAASRYMGARSGEWLKFKCSARQELVIGGYTKPQGSRIGFGALLLGYHENGHLQYAGKVGTGFDEDLLTRLGARLAKLEQKRSPFDDDADLPRDTHFVQPELVAEIGFTEWTGSGKLRHPRFLGLRNDKRARDVRRERPR